MSHLLKRPGLWTAAPAWACFLPLWAALSLWPLPALYSWGAWCVVALCCALVEWPDFRQNCKVLCLALALSSLFCYLCLARLNVTPSISPEEHRFLVLDLSESDWSVVATLRDEAGVNWLWYPRQEEVIPGTYLQGHVTQQKASLSDLVRYKGRRVAGVVRLKETQTVQGPASLARLLARWRYRLAEQFESLPLRTRTLAKATYLGIRDPQGAEEYRRWGAAHFIAVSGWHVGIVLALCPALFGTGLFGAFASTIFLALYVVFGGASFSALRAFFLALVCLWGSALGNRRTTINALGVALTLTLVFWPGSVFSLSWQLSALATVLVLGLQVWKVSGFLVSLPAMWLIPAPIAAPLSGGLFQSTLPLSAMFPLFSLIFTTCWLLTLPFVLGLPGAWLPILLSEKLLAFWALIADFWVDLLPKAYILSRSWIALSLAVATLVLARRLTRNWSVILSAALLTGALVWCSLALWGVMS